MPRPGRESASRRHFASACPTASPQMIVQRNLDCGKMLLPSISGKIRRLAGPLLAFAALILCQQAASTSVANAETALVARALSATPAAGPLHAAACHEGAAGDEAAIGMAGNPELGWLLETRGPRLSRSTGDRKS